VTARTLDGIPGSLPFQSRGLRVVACILAVTVGLLLGFGGPRFQTTPSLALINHLGLPWPVGGILFITYGLLLLGAPLVRFAGWMMGAFLYSFFTVALVWAMVTGPPVQPPLVRGALNPAILGALVLCIAFHVVSGWNASRLADLDGSA
jgi:hypothetical protein